MMPHRIAWIIADQRQGRVDTLRRTSMKICGDPSRGMVAGLAARLFSRGSQAAHKVARVSLEGARNGRIPDLEM